MIYTSECLVSANRSWYGVAGVGGWITWGLWSTEGFRVPADVCTIGGGVKGSASANLSNTPYVDTTAISRLPDRTRPCLCSTTYITSHQILSTLLPYCNHTATILLSYCIRGVLLSVVWSNTATLGDGRNLICLCHRRSDTQPHPSHPIVKGWG
jgi:hypothetical protein